MGYKTNPNFWGYPNISEYKKLYNKGIYFKGKIAIVVDYVYYSNWILYVLGKWVLNVYTDL